MTLEPTQVEELVKTLARFRKAQRIADILDGEGVTYADTHNMTDEAWDLTIRAARLSSASIVTRGLACELIRDREERKQRGEFQRRRDG